MKLTKLRHNRLRPSGRRGKRKGRPLAEWAALLSALAACLAAMTAFVSEISRFLDR